MRNIPSEVQSFLSQLMPILLASGTIIIAGGFIYFAMRYMAKRRHFVLRQRFDFLWALATLLVVFNTGANLFPFEGQVPQVLLNWTAFAAFLLYFYLLVFIVDQFLVEYFLVSVLKIYVSPPIRKAIGIVFMALAIIVGVQLIFDINPWAIYAPTSLLSLGLGLALKDSFKMFFAGISVSRIVHIGDWVQIKGFEGEVLDIDWARTVLRTREGNRIFVPNNEFQEQIFTNCNLGEKNTRFKLEIAAPYGQEPERIKKILLDCIVQTEGILKDPAPCVFMEYYKDFYIQYALYFWVQEYGLSQQYLSSVSENVWHAFKRENIEIPFPTQTIHIASGSPTVS